VLEGFSILNLCVTLCLICSYHHIFANKLYQSLVLVIRMLGFPTGASMLTIMKYNLPLLDFDTRFLLWQVKMRAVLVHHDLNDALEGFGKRDRKACESPLMSPRGG
jgi:hypothetical protein